MQRSFLVLAIFIFILSACNKGISNQPVEQPSLQPTAEGRVTDQGGDMDAVPPTETPAATPTDASLLSPEPQEIQFQASDGQALTGYYYPASVDPAPMVVLMHWAGGDKADWYEIAPWLQNRTLANPFTNPGNDPWWDPTWFPTIPEGDSVAVFIFSFRGCKPASEGCTDFSPDGWLLDAQAAMQTAAGLQGVDPEKVVAMGSSIGADGALDACAWMNEQNPGSCAGALSLSPGNYLDVPYILAVTRLGQVTPPVAVWCLADEKEFGICEMAEAAPNPAYRNFMIQDGSHGNMLLRPGLSPLPMQIILDFLDETVKP